MEYKEALKIINDFDPILRETIIFKIKELMNTLEHGNTDEYWIKKGEFYMYFDKLLQEKFLPAYDDSWIELYFELI